MLKLLIDENLDQRILRGLQLRVPDLSYTLVQETALAGAHDARYFNGRPGTSTSL